MRRILFLKFVAVSAAALLTACATEQKNTHVENGYTLPVPVDGIVLVYEVATLTTDKPQPVDRMKASRDLVLEKFQTAATTRIPQQLNAAGIAHVVVIETPGVASKAVDAPASWRRLHVRAASAEQTCTGLGSCSLRLKVATRLMAADGKTTIWSTEVEEPQMASSVIYDARYQELAGHVGTAILGAVTRKR